ncbi:MAG: hypothetical protein JRG73_07365 [Deltaproteobacteria bacterium]|nr:hypothetical protein [Deltaproteobacteria bacterium]MBW2306744.1 hypothetical protein [Deltaproteobacteria bacterium]
MREREKIMLIGIGELGGIVLEYLCRIPNICEIVTADFNADWGFRKTNSAIEGAAYMGLYPLITFHHLNLLDIEKTAELLKKINPTIIFNGTTLQSWWVVNELPPEVNARIYKHRCGLGPWAAMHLALTSKLMKAVKMSGIDTYVVNSSYPDVINASLSRVGHVPTIGIGNMDLAIPYIQKAVSELLDVPMRNVGVEMIAHHYHAYYWCRHGTGSEAPFYLRVYVGHEDVTARLGDMKNFISELPKRGMRPGGRHGQFVVAGSCVKNIMAIYNDTGEITHSPGPQGLEGGYPVRLSRKGAEVALPKGVTLQEAREINLKAQQFEGIKEIRDNGDIVFMDEAYITFKEMLNVDCKVVTVEHSYEQAMELRKKFHEFAGKHGVAVSS